MESWFSSMKENFSKWLKQFMRHSNGRGSSAGENYDNARMSYTRLQALEGAGYRQCYMERLREANDTVEQEAGTKERWFGDAPATSNITIKMEEEAEKRRQKLAQAQHSMSYTRLQALVQQMSPDERLLNETEAKRLGDSSSFPIIDVGQDADRNQV